MRTVPKIIEHIERNIESIADLGVGKTIEINLNKIHLLKFNDQPFKEVSTICTSGLSKHIFQSSLGEISQELLFGYFSIYESDNWHPILSVICEDLLKSHMALEMGEIYKVDSSFFPCNNMVALYCSYPVFYGDDIWVCAKTNPPTYFIWLFPVTKDEVHYVEKYGGEQFEKKLIMVQQPRLFDFNRESLKI